MAIIRHLASKNADYGAYELRLRYVCDPKSGRPLSDEDGNLIERKDTLIGTLGCGDDGFAVACMKANLHYRKNRFRDEVKVHHYIIAFDPRDETGCGLTRERAMELGTRFCRENLPGHQTLLGVSRADSGSICIRRQTRTAQSFLYQRLMPS